MNLLFLCHFFPPAYASGAENYTFNLARALVHEGHQIHVLCAETWDRGENYWNGYTEETYAGVRVRRLHLSWHKALDPNRYLYDNPVTAEHLRAWLREIEPDIVHITSCYTLSASVIGACKEAGLPVLLTLVDFWFLCPRLLLLRSDGTLCDGQTTPWDCLKCMLFEAKAYRWPAKFLSDSIIRPVLTAASASGTINRLPGLRGMALNMGQRKRVLAGQLRQAAMILAPSQFLASVHAAVTDDLPIRVHPYGHDLDWLIGYRRRSSDRELRFCYLGQIAHHKGVHMLIEAFLRLNSVPAIVLDIWGGTDSDSTYAAYIQELATRSNNINLHGRFRRSQLADVLSQADVAVVPSIWYENNPLVIQEAFAAQVPVIATDLGGMSEFVKHEVNGLLFERGNVTDLARQMQRIIQEPALLAQLRAGIPPVKTIEQEVDELIAVYAQLRGQKRFE